MEAKLVKELPPDPIAFIIAKLQAIEKANKKVRVSGVKTLSNLTRASKADLCVCFCITSVLRNLVVTCRFHYYRQPEAYRFNYSKSS